MNGGEAPHDAGKSDSLFHMPVCGHVFLIVDRHESEPPDLEINEPRAGDQEDRQDHRLPIDETLCPAESGKAIWFGAHRTLGGDRVSGARSAVTDFCSRLSSAVGSEAGLGRHKAVPDLPGGRKPAPRKTRGAGTLLDRRKRRAHRAHRGKKKTTAQWGRSSLSMRRSRTVRERPSSAAR